MDVVIYGFIAFLLIIMMMSGFGYVVLTVMVAQQSVARAEKEYEILMADLLDIKTQIADLRSLLSRRMIKLGGPPR